MGRPAAATAYTAAMDALFSPEMVTVLMVDDDAELAAMVVELLQAQGMQVHSAGTAAQGMAALTRLQPDVLLLDLMLPDANGLDLCRRLREAGNDVPVLMLTARGDPFDRVLGLELGADDYLVKPFSFAELLARVRIILRRGRGNQEATTIQVADLELDLLRRRVTRAGKRIDLTAKEFGLLELLMRRQGEVLPRSLIASQVWDVNFDSDTNVIEVAMRRLRAKVDEGFEPRLIQTVRGMGYVLEAPEAPR